MDVNLPRPNPALTAVLMSPTMARIVEERANTAAALYQSQVAKRTGRLAATAHAGVEVGGMKHDRFVGTLTVGGPGPLGVAGYAAAHEFGHNTRTGVAAAAHDLNRVLQLLEFT